MNLHDHWGVPYSQMELTPMIGGNDVAGETVTPADADMAGALAAARSGAPGFRYVRHLYLAGATTFESGFDISCRNQVVMS
ncbi:hypothetical protein [Burkholderia ubonensis]|uniref:hypothetical protein n=1 Tax=Burkholderia ubonensis TaxID=101571 RepID=UPI002109678A|nr:hypothetical protein [Burkholderia ubonensis]